MCVVRRKHTFGSRSRWTFFFEAVPAWWGCVALAGGRRRARRLRSGPVVALGVGGGSARTSLADYRA